jgi:hypothetical protein
MAEGVDHTHGDTGDKPPQNLDFQTGGFPEPQEFDWFWSEVPAAINDHKALLEAIDSDEDGIVDEAELAQSASSYKGQEIDSDGDGQVDAADFAADADTVDGVEAVDLSTDVSDDGTLVVASVEDIDFGSDLSVTDDADGTVTVEAAAQPDTHVDVLDGTTVVVTDPTNISFGANLTAIDDGDGSVTVTADDDASTYKGNDIDGDADGQVNAADEADAVRGNDGTTHTAGSVPEFASVSDGESAMSPGDQFVVNQSDGYHVYLVE